MRCTARPSSRNSPKSPDASATACLRASRPGCSPLLRIWPRWPDGSATTRAATGAAQRYWSYGLHAAAEAGQRDRGVEIVTRMSHQMIYLGRPTDALDLLALAVAKAEHPTVKALVASQTGRVQAALGDHRAADRNLGSADDLIAGGGEHPAPAWVAYFDAAEHAGARAVAARDLAAQKQPTTPASDHFRDALTLRKPGFDRVRTMDRIGPRRRPVA
ncbi:hypothetical protein ACU686_09825 [Yinghuangia aomiensis]